jgi:hypothetical protein
MNKAAESAKGILYEMRWHGGHPPQGIGYNTRHCYGNFMYVIFFNP